MNATLPCALLALALTACASEPPFDPEDLAVGPGGMVGNGAPLTDGVYAGGNDVLPPPRTVAVTPDDTRPPNCDGACAAYCAGAGLQNPVNRGLCRSLWGVGLAHRPVDAAEACRRLFIDLVGRVPTADEAEATCQGRWGDTARALMADEAFVALNQRRAADRFLYSTEVVSVQSIYDMDRLVAKLHRGLVPYDLFAAVASAHPVMTRRNADPADRAEALFKQFLGRPPFEHERADMARLYRLWYSGYYDHPYLNMRLPDAFLRYRCINQETGAVDEEHRGECASVLWGYNEVILKPDLRAAADRSINALTTWHGLLRASEWEQLAVPGRILATQREFWEKAVDDVLQQYLGYDLAAQVPEVREELVEWLFRYQGDIRAVHHAVVTSAAYLQSTAGAGAAPRYRWTYGPLKQMQAEVWLDSMARAAGVDVGACDHRISRPQDFLAAGSVPAYRVLQKSRWRLNGEGRVDTGYAEVARTLGGCPENVSGGRYTVVSILTTATQLSFVHQLCDPAGAGGATAARAQALLPDAVTPARALDVALAGDVARHQYRLLLGRAPPDVELTEARGAGEQCAASGCTAEQFARPFCFALLSSAERTFY